MKKLLSATATPLASIFGSGFLIIVPILNGAVGKYSVLPMAIVFALEYIVGHAIRFNIKHVEPRLASGNEDEELEKLEGAADLALVVAYVISVCLYANILASFLLGGFGDNVDSVMNEHNVSAIVIAIIGLVGYFHGLEVLERLETVGLVVTLAIVVAMFIGFGAFDIKAAAEGITWPRTPNHTWWEVLTIVGGTLIVVQGFETSRYLGEQYDSQTRIKSCRLSQLISTFVYIIFVALSIPLMHFLGDTVKDNDLIMLAGKASALLPIPLIFAAVLSQFSAAVADTVGGGGNMVEATHGRVNARHAYLLICTGALVLTLFPTLTILALASRAFALYYLLQCLIAMKIAESKSHQTFFAVIAVILGFITLFAVPAG